MMQWFYERHSRHFLWCLVIALPVLHVLAAWLPGNNDVEAWLPGHSAVRSEYEAFKADFGNEESIVVGLPNRAIDDPFVEAVAGRIERLPGVRGCWTPARFEAAMAELGVERSVARSRLRGLVLSAGRETGGTEVGEAEAGEAVSGDREPLVGIVAQLSDEGHADRAGTVDAIRGALEYCGLSGGAVLLSGAPVVVTELDRLGNRDSNKRFFLLTLVISLVLLRVCTRRWGLALAILGSTVWAIDAVLAGVYLAGGEMNFIMGSLSIMVMVFTMAVAIHFVHYFRTALREMNSQETGTGRVGGPIGTAFARSWRPCCLATLTTVIGLLSLMVSEMPPVQAFGLAAAYGCVVALFVGLLVTPAILVVLPPPAEATTAETTGWFARTATWLLDRPRTVAIVAGLLVVTTAIGVPWIESRIDPLDFLPRNGKVAGDVRTIEERLTNIDTIEAVVDFGRDGRVGLPFLEKLDEVRRLEGIVRANPAVHYTMSAATFFPERMPVDAFEAAGLLGRAQAMEGQGDFTQSGQRLWRISARIGEDREHTRGRILDELRAATAGAPITFTGIAPLLDHAQRTIFDGFWTSFTTAFAIISVVMVVSLRSLRMGLVAMIPNLTPICLVFGTLGWVGFPVDIGMTMTASIALGIAVDGTFHFLVRYDAEFRRRGDGPGASRAALLATGVPILEAAVIASLGMLALTLSPFTPTARFGTIMATLLTTALVGDLVLLPALLALRPSRPTDAEPPVTETPLRRPHWLMKPLRLRSRAVESV